MAWEKILATSSPDEHHGGTSKRNTSEEQHGASWSRIAEGYSREIAWEKILATSSRDEHLGRTFTRMFLDLRRASRRNISDDGGA